MRNLRPSSTSSSRSVRIDSSSALIARLAVSASGVLFREDVVGDSAFLRDLSACSGSCADGIKLLVLALSRHFEHQARTHAGPLYRVICGFSDRARDALELLVDALPLDPQAGVRVLP